MSGNRSVVVMEQPQTEVYTGDTGYIVIKQKDWQGEDQLIMIDPLHAETIAEAILAQRNEAKQAFNEWRDGDDE